MNHYHFGDLLSFQRLNCGSNMAGCVFLREKSGAMASTEDDYQRVTRRRWSVSKNRVFPIADSPWSPCSWKHDQHFVWLSHIYSYIHIYSIQKIHWPRMLMLTPLLDPQNLDHPFSALPAPPVSSDPSSPPRLGPSPQAASEKKKKKHGWWFHQCQIIYGMMIITFSIHL